MPIQPWPRVYLPAKGFSAFFKFDLDWTFSKLSGFFFFYSPPFKTSLPITFPLIWSDKANAASESGLEDTLAGMSRPSSIHLNKVD